MILHVFLVSHKNATSNEFNLLDHQKMRPLKFDGWHCVSEYGLHVGIEIHSGAASRAPWSIVALLLLPGPGDSSFKRSIMSSSGQRGITSYWAPWGLSQ